MREKGLKIYPNQEIMMTCDPFTNQELDQLYDLVRDKHDDVMRGDWEAVKPDIADLHLLMSKLIYAQMKLNNS